MKKKDIRKLKFKQSDKFIQILEIIVRLQICYEIIQRYDKPIDAWNIQIYGWNMS